jgi:thioredoxin-related protein
MRSMQLLLVAASCLMLLAAATPQKKDRPPLYDPAADSFADLEKAIAEAQESGQRILLTVGGNWCGWCYALNDYIKANEDVHALLEESFVSMKVNMDQENDNEEFLSQYPDINGYPHLFVLDSDGTFLHSQSTGPLEEGRSYDKAKLMGFLKEWGAGR